MTQKDVLIDVVNGKGYVVRQIHEWIPTSFGKSNIITIENSTHRITFVTNVLNGVNYFTIFQVFDVYKNVTYKASKYFTKFISLINNINGETFIKINTLEKDVE